MDEIGDWLADFVRESSVFIIFYFDIYISLLSLRLKYSLESM